MTKNSPIRSIQRFPGCFAALCIAVPVCMGSGLHQIRTIKTISSNINKTRMSSKEVNNPIGIAPIRMVCNRPFMLCPVKINGTDNSPSLS